MSQMMAAQAQKQVRASPDGGILQRKCDKCPKKEKILRRAAAGPSPDTVPPIVHEVLRSPGQPLDASTRAFMEPRFGHDFSQVRVHTDSQATRSAQAVESLAYTVGRDIVFAPGTYRPTSAEGQRLIAHELVHVIQQYATLDRPPEGTLAVEQSSSAQEIEARRVATEFVHRPADSVNRVQAGSGAISLLRADQDAVSQILKLRTVVGASIQFWPTNVTDTRIGPVTVQPGLLSAGVSRLNVIVGQNLTPRIYGS